MAWQNAIQRCENPRFPRYQDYGGRGIAFHPAWRHDFRAFLRDVGPRPSAQHSLDRVDVNGHYEPGNVRWATTAEQNRNQRRPTTARRCEGCSQRFEPARITQRHCRPACRVRALRGRRRSISAGVRYVVYCSRCRRIVRLERAVQLPTGIYRCDSCQPDALASV
jgi:hypothetical protein